MYATWLEFTSIVLALARFAIMRSWSGLIDRSAVATMYQLGLDFQAGLVTLCVNESVEIGTCDTAMKCDNAGETSAAKSAAKCFWSIQKFPLLSCLIAFVAGGKPCSIAAQLSPSSRAIAAI